MSINSKDWSGIEGRQQPAPGPNGSSAPGIPEQALDSWRRDRTPSVPHDSAARRGVPGAAPKVPFADKLTSVLGLGPIPFTKVIRTGAIVREAARGAGADETGELTPMEDSGRLPVIGKAQKALDAAIDGPIETTSKSLRGVFSGINVTEKRLDEALRTKVRGPSGALITIEEANREQRELDNSVNSERKDGSLRHERTKSSKAKNIAMVVIDLPVFFWLMLGLFNVSIVAAIYGDVANITKAVLALTVAVFCTLLLAAVMRSIGRRHRRFKGVDGSIMAAGATRRRTVLEIFALGFVVIVAASLMFARMAGEAQEAGSSPFLAYCLGGLMAALIGLAAYLNYVATYDDGSIETDRLDFLAYVQASHGAVVASLRSQLAMLLEQAGILMTLLERQIAEARTNAHHIVTRSAADKAIRVARSYSGNKTPLPTPALDVTRLELVEKQARQHKEHLTVLQAEVDAMSASGD